MTFEKCGIMSVAGFVLADCIPSTMPGVILNIHVDEVQNNNMIES